MLQVEGNDSASGRRRDELLERLRRVVEEANPTALDILEVFVDAAETNDEVRRRRASGDADPLNGDRLACFFGGRLDENGSDVKPADREACGERLRDLQRRSRIQAKFHARELSLLEYITGAEE